MSRPRTKKVRRTGLEGAIGRSIIGLHACRREAKRGWCGKRYNSATYVANEHVSVCLSYSVSYSLACSIVLYDYCVYYKNKMLRSLLNDDFCCCWREGRYISYARHTIRATEEWTVRSAWSEGASIGTPHPRVIIIYIGSTEIYSRLFHSPNYYSVKK